MSTAIHESTNQNSRDSPNISRLQGINNEISSNISASGQEISLMQGMVSKVFSLKYFIDESPKEYALRGA